FAIAISAFNALTLSPALSAIFLGHEHGRGRFFSGVNRVIVSVTDGYRHMLRRLLGFETVAVIVFFCGLALTYFVYARVPKGFVPVEDQGYIITAIQAPEGASLEYTSGVSKKVEATLQKIPEVGGVFGVTGFSFAGSAPNRGLVFATLNPLAERRGHDHSAEAIVNRARPDLMKIGGAIIVPFLPPAIQGLGVYGGFQFEVQDQGGNTLQALADATNQLVRQGNSGKQLAGLFSSYTANDPQFVVTIDREKAKTLQVPLAQITDALQVYMGSVYVNDFDFNNRSYRVYIQADQRFRSEPKDLREFYVRSDRGAMIPLDNLTAVTQTTTPQVISHYNLFRSAEIDGSPAPGRSSGQGMEDMEALAKKALPQGMGYEWTGLSLEERQSGGQSVILFGLGLLVVYLTLAAQYESFSLPFIVLLAVPMAVLGALGAQSMRGLENDVYC